MVSLRKVVGLGLAGVITLSLTAGAVWAFVVDTEASAGNQVTAGTLDLAVDGATQWASTVITIGPLKPGASGTPVAIQLTNAGTIVGDLYVKISSVTNSGGTAVYPSGDPKASNELEYVAEGGPGSWSAVDNISTKVTLTANDGTNPISGINNTHLSAVPGGWTLVKSSFITGTPVTVNMNGTLDADTGIQYQGDRSTFTIEFIVVQTGQTP